MENPDFIQTNLEQAPKPKLKSRFVLIIGFILVAFFAYQLGFKAGRQGYVFDPKSFKVINQADQPQIVDYSLLWDALNILDTKFIDKPLNPQKALYGSIRGAVASTGDPYTDFFEPKALETFKTDLKGSFDGIGAEVSKKDGLIVIVAPLDESPAKKAGLKAQDIILKVNGEDVSGWSVEEAVNKIRGPKGSEVTLTIFRQGGEKPFEVTIKRDVIRIKSVKWEFKTQQINGQSKIIAVINLTKFGDDTETLFKQAVNELLRKGVDGIVLDLRNDPGGYLQTAVEISSNWLKSGTLVVTEAKSTGENILYKSEGSGRLYGVPTVVLINGGSASASEILAGALQDHKMAKLVGEKSFGKGSVQELVELKDGSALKVTVAKWVTPGGKNLNKEGLTPDIEIKISDEDLKNNKDTQLEKALEEVIK